MLSEVTVSSLDNANHEFNDSQLRRKVPPAQPAPDLVLSGQWVKEKVKVRKGKPPVGMCVKAVKGEQTPIFYIYMTEQYFFLSIYSYFFGFLECMTYNCERLVSINFVCVNISDSQNKEIQFIDMSVTRNCQHRTTSKEKLMDDSVLPTGKPDYRNVCDLKSENKGLPSLDTRVKRRTSTWYWISDSESLQEEQATEIYNLKAKERKAIWRCLSDLQLRYQRLSYLATKL